VAETIAGLPGHVNYAAVPMVIYTEPELAWAGRSEQALKAEGVRYRSGVFPLRASGRAQAAGQTTGLVKVLGAAQDDRLLGVHILAPHASELVAEAVTALEFSASTEDLARTVHAHPTLAEALHEAALAADGRAIHI
jgi:dihydrolipoamide dehydrogenase